MYRIVRTMIGQLLLVAVLVAAVLAAGAMAAPAEAEAATIAPILIELGCRLQALPTQPDLVVTEAGFASGVTVQNQGCAATTSGFAVTATEEDGTRTSFAVTQLLGIGGAVEIPYAFGCSGDETRFDADARSQVIELRELNNQATFRHINC